jgi:hypothetical protein
MKLSDAVYRCGLLLAVTVLGTLANVGWVSADDQSGRPGPQSPAREIVRIEPRSFHPWYAIAPDSKKLVYGGQVYNDDLTKFLHGELAQIDLTTGKELNRERVDSAYTGVLSADGRILVITHTRGDFWGTVWDLSVWKPKIQLKRLEGYVLGAPLAFSPDCKYLAGRLQRKGDYSCREDLVVWDLATGKCRVLDSGPAKLLGGIGNGASVMIGNDGKPDPKAKAPFEGPFVGLRLTAVNFAEQGGPRQLFVQYQAGFKQFITTLWNAETGKPLRSHWDGVGEHSFRYRTCPSGRILALPKYRPWPIMALAHQDWTIGLGVRPSPYSSFVELCRLDEFKGTTQFSCQLSPDCRRLIAGGFDPKTVRTEKPVSVIRVWDVSGLHPIAAKKMKLNGVERQRLWNDLFKDDTQFDQILTGSFRVLRTQEYYITQAMTSLVFHGDVTVAWLRKKIGPPFDLKNIPQLIDDLESEQFQKRAQAKRELEQRGQLARPFLERALKNNPPAETKKQVESLLNKLHQTEATYELTQLRIIDVLEHINTKAARDLLQLIADGKYDPAYAGEAKAALKRIAKEPSR